MSEQAVSIEAVAQHIRSAARNYPRGISQSAAKAAFMNAAAALRDAHIVQSESAMHRWGAAAARLHFFVQIPNATATPWSGEFAALLRAIIEKGLRSTVEDCCVTVVPSGMEVSHAMIAECQEQYCLVCGDFLAADVDGYTFGAWADVAGVPLLHTLSLAAISSDVQKKRTFWGHLKQVAEVL